MRAPVAKPDRGLEPDEPPPLLGRWPRLYAAVIGWLALLILAFYCFARYFAP
jgi:hypothetical protein